MIYLSEDIGKPLYEQLYEVLKNYILNGTLRKNQALRPIRVLAEELNISNNTVSHAYGLLMSEGYIRAVAGSGYYVEDARGFSDLGAPMARPLPRREAGLREYPPLLYDFKYESIDAALFPWKKWRQYMLEAISLESYQSSISYETNKGSEALRKSIRQYLNASRGIACDPEQVIICAGTQYGLEIIMNILKASKVAFEEPGYDAVRRLFLNKGCEIVPIPLDGGGLDFEVLEHFEGLAGLNALYLTPSHQFPTGITTSMPGRLRLLKLATANDLYIIENDYDNEFLHGHKRLPALRSLNADKVIYLSTLSKVLSPSLRCAYCVLPEHLLSLYEALYGYYNAALPSCNQTALSNFIDDGRLDKHARKMSAVNKRKHEIFIAGLDEFLGGKVEISDNPAGSHILIRIHGCHDQERLITEMRKRAIGIYGTKEYWYIAKQAPEDVFLLGYNSMPEQKIQAGCRALGEALRDML